MIKQDRKETIKNNIIYNEQEFPMGHLCKCGEKHYWPAYVFAHKHVTIIFTCPTCGSKVSILEYKINDLMEDE